MVRKYTGANWNEKEDSFTQKFLEQNQTQFWMPEEIPLANDVNLWKTLDRDVQWAYAQNLLVLTFLDTYQGDIGMTTVSNSIPDENHQRKAVLNFMASMENGVHAKSYSNIFMTYMNTEDINELFEWGEQNKNLQAIVHTIVGNYEKLKEYTYLKEKSGYLRKDDLTTRRLLENLLSLGMDNKEEIKELTDKVVEKYNTLDDLDKIKVSTDKMVVKPISEEEYLEVQWKAYVSSVFLETYLFYSGFYYPLWFSGQGKLTQAGEIINLIIRDEQIHGIYIGLLAQEIFEKFSASKKEELTTWMYNLMDNLYYHQSKVMEEIYNPVGLTDDVKEFVKYNGNKAMMNLGFSEYFDVGEVNPVVLKGLDTKSKTMDNFSQKGNGYQKIALKSLSNDYLSYLDSIDAISTKVVGDVDVNIGLLKKDTKDILNDVKNKFKNLDTYSPDHIKVKNLEMALNVSEVVKYLNDNNHRFTKQTLETFVLGDDFYAEDLLAHYIEGRDLNTEIKDKLLWVKEYYESELLDGLSNLIGDYYTDTEYARTLLLDILLENY